MWSSLVSSAVIRMNNTDCSLLTCKERKLYVVTQDTMNTTFPTLARRASDPNTPTPAGLRWPREPHSVLQGPDFTPARRSPSSTGCWPTTAPSPTGSWACRRGRWWSWSRSGAGAGGLSGSQITPTLKAGPRRPIWREYQAGRSEPHDKISISLTLCFRHSRERHDRK